VIIKRIRKGGFSSREMKKLKENDAEGLWIFMLRHWS